MTLPHEVSDVVVALGLIIAFVLLLMLVLPRD